MARIKGITYGNDAFPKPYAEATANQTQVFFGSDAAAKHMAPLWGEVYQSSTNASCGPPGSEPMCRNDLHRMKEMGVELIRLYDWEPRNYHKQFLDECHRLGIGVLVSVSNYFLRRDRGLPKKDEHIRAMIRSYSKLPDNQGGDDYHPAVEGIVFGNEFDGYGVDECVEFTQAWIEIERNDFSSHRPVPIGHPIAFIDRDRYPCWDVWDRLLPALNEHKGRLFLAPQTYNEAAFLFHDAKGSGRGYVDLTYDQYQTPILFTEIGADRITRPNHVEIVKGQLSGCIAYARQNPHKLTGACFFSYTDKVWAEGSEGAFGAWTHTDQNDCTITYGAEDFTHWDGVPFGTLNVDEIRHTDLYEAVKSSYVGT